MSWPICNFWQLFSAFFESLFRQNFRFQGSVISLRPLLGNLENSNQKTSTDFSVRNMLKLRRFKDFGDRGCLGTKTPPICDADSDFQNERKTENRENFAPDLHQSPKSLKRRIFITFGTENPVGNFLYLFVFPVISGRKDFFPGIFFKRLRGSVVPIPTPVLDTNLQT